MISVITKLYTVGGVTFGERGKKEKVLLSKKKRKLFTFPPGTGGSDRSRPEIKKSPEK